jgi:hypothetical protein
MRAKTIGVPWMQPGRYRKNVNKIALLDSYALNQAHGCVFSGAQIWSNLAQRNLNSNAEFVLPGTLPILIHFRDDGYHEPQLERYWTEADIGLIETFLPKGKKP